MVYRYQEYLASPVARRRVPRGSLPSQGRGAARLPILLLALARWHREVLCVTRDGPILQLRRVGASQSGKVVGGLGCRGRVYSFGFPLLVVEGRFARA